MSYKQLLLLLATIALFSCSKDGETHNGMYIVSASKMIRLKTDSWDQIEPQLKNKKGYQYNKAANNLSNVLKAIVELPAVDDSNRSVKGRILLNVAPDNRIIHASFDADPLSRTLAYAMMLNYNHETLKTLTGITSSIGQIQENRNGRNDKVDVVLSKLQNGQEADILGITYYTGQGQHTMVVFRQDDGRYIFSYR